MRPRLARLLVLCTLAALATGTALVAGSRDLVLGAAGEVYQARVGLYGDLFPGGGEAAAEASVISLDITRSGEAARRLLVPGTEGHDVESAPFLLFEDSTHSVFLLWQSTVNYIHPILRLASFDGERWSEPIEITGNPFARKSAPYLAITRDPGTGTDHARTVLHLVWAEEGATGAYDSYYTPIVLVDGAYLGWNPVFPLATLDAVTPATIGGGDGELLARSPVVAPGRDGRTAVIAFTSAATGRLTTVEVDVLPQPLAQLADRARHQIILVGARSSAPAELRRLADQVKAALLVETTAFEPEVLEVLIAGAEQAILAGGDDLHALAERARHQIILVGSRLTDRGLRTAAAASVTQEISAAPEASEGAHLFQFRVIGRWVAPELREVGEAGVRVLVSESAQAVLVAWQVGGGVRYHLGNGGGWSPERELSTTNQITLDRAFEILEQRLRGR